MKTKFWYRIQNCGDGSAAIEFCESEALARVLDQHQDEGWGEPCCGCVEVESDSLARLCESVTTVEGSLAEINEDYDEGDSYYPSERVAALRELQETPE